MTETIYERLLNDSVTLNFKEKTRDYFGFKIYSYFQAFSDALPFN